VVSSCLLLALLSGAQSAAADLRWDCDVPADIESTAHLSGAVVCDGALKGLSTWDPFFYLRLPEGGIKAADYRSLEVRLFSSAPADLLDIYYKTAQGYWCLGGSLPIKAGWAVYSVDLQANRWRETTQGDQSRQWGGPDGNVISFRLDPGNQAERWIMVDWARLTPEVLPTEVRPEPALSARLLRADAPAEVPAGQPLRVTLAYDLGPGPAPQRVTAYARLEAPEVLIAAVDKPLDVAQPGRTTVSLDLPSLPFVSTTATLRAGLYEAFGDEAVPDDTIRRVKLVLAPTARADFPVCRVQPLGGSPAVHVDGKPLPFFCFSAPRAFSQLDPAAKSAHAEMGEAGVPIFSDWFGTSGDGFLGHTGPGEYDYSAFDVYFARVVQRAPRALFLPHVYVTAPLWWQQAYPEELCGYHDGGHGCQSFASERWRREVGDDLVRLIRHLRRSPYADRIIGLVICSGHTAEWQTWGLWDDKFTDYSDVAVQAYRSWLRERYGSDDALRRAWARPEASLAAAVPPSPEERTAASHLMLRDPVADGPVLDYLAFINDLTADAILHFMRQARQASDDRLLLGTYYGYLTQHHFHQAESGHCGIEKVLASPDLDFLMSPPLYTERQVGAVSGFMSATESVHAHGKVWLSEADYRTHLSDPASGFGRTSTVDETLAVLWREFAHVLTKRAGVSHMDMVGGWLAGLDIPREFGKMVRIMRESLASRRPWHAEVAVFIDPHSYYCVRPGRTSAFLSLYPVVNLFRAGAPFDLYVLSDLWKADLPDYKLYVFLNAFALDEAARRKILERTRRPGVSALWHWAAGSVWPDKSRLATAAEMSDLVGLRLEEVGEEEAFRLAAAPGADAYAARLPGLIESLNPAIPLGPVFVPRDGETLALLSPGDRPALARAEIGDARAFYSALPCLPPTLLRQVYADAGVHLYLDGDNCFYADGEWVGVHALLVPPDQAPATQHVTLTLPSPVVARSVRSGFTGTGSRLELDLPAPGTELLRLRPEGRQFRQGWLRRP